MAEAVVSEDDAISSDELRGDTGNDGSVTKMTEVSLIIYCYIKITGRFYNLLTPKLHFEVLVIYNCKISGV